MKLTIVPRLLLLVLAASIIFPAGILGIFCKLFWGGFRIGWKEWHQKLKDFIIDNTLI